jgi:GTPase SAR1 family protein
MFLRNAPNGDSSAPKFRVAMLGASGVGKTALTCQFAASEYDSSLGECSQRTASRCTHEMFSRLSELEI